MLLSYILFPESQTLKHDDMVLLAMMLCNPRLWQLHFFEADEVFDIQGNAKDRYAAITTQTIP